MKGIIYLIFFGISGVICAQDFTLPELRFSYDAYEQGIDAKTMEIRQKKQMEARWHQQINYFDGF